jgi:predicted membrane-bound spermidine synthase
MSTAIPILSNLGVAMRPVAIALPGLPLRIRVGPLRPSWSIARALAYFTCLGMGFIGIELGLIQKFSLFLGHPVYSLVVLLPSILFFSGVGSFSARKIAPEDGVARIVALVVVLGLYSFCIRPLTTALIGSPFALKCAVAIAMSSVPAFFMGMLFPLVIASIRASTAALIPWVWAINSGFSVLGGTVSLFVSMGWGYTKAWYGFMAFYLLAAVLLRSMKPQRGRSIRWSPT